MGSAGLLAGMRVALLSCGPSVAKYEAQTKRYDVIIGVNRIVGKHYCDYWVFGDTETFLAVEPIGRPILVTDDATTYSLAHNYYVGLDEYQQISWESLFNPLPLDTQLAFSACAALLLVKHLRATSLDVFGVDMKGDAEWDGRTHPDRGEDRWQRERLRWEYLIEWLRTGGISAVFSK